MTEDQAMKRNAKTRKRNTRRDPSTDRKPSRTSPAEATAGHSDAESDEAIDLDESEFRDIDDRHWDVFVLGDDDWEPMPDYGDFWLPD
jgi:hypothetical protein